MSYLEHDSLDHGNEIKRRIIRRMVSMIELTEASLRRLQPLGIKGKILEVLVPEEK